MITSVLNSRSGRNWIRALRTEGHFVGAKYHLAKVDRHGTITFSHNELGPHPLVLAHPFLLKKMTDQPVHLSINHTIAEQPAILIYSSQDHTSPLLCFFIDNEGSPYWLPANNMSLQKRQCLAKIYCLPLSKTPVKINGITFYCGHEQITNCVNLNFDLNNNFIGAQTILQKDLPWSTITDQSNKPIGITVGRVTSDAPIFLGISGFYGPFPIMRHIAKGQIVYYYFPSKGNTKYLISLKDLEKLQITIGEKNCSLITQFENGFPLVIFSPTDTSFANPIYFRVFRDEIWQIIASGRTKANHIDFKGLVIIEGNEAKMYTPNSVDQECVSCFIDHKRKYIASVENMGIRPEHVSLIIYDKQYLLLALPVARLTEELKTLAQQAILFFNRHKNKQDVKKLANRIRLITWTAYQAWLQRDTGLFEKLLKKLSVPLKQDIPPVSLDASPKTAEKPKTQPTPTQLIDRGDILYGKIIAFGRSNAEVIISLANELFEILNEQLIQAWFKNKKTRSFFVSAAHLKFQAASYILSNISIKADTSILNQELQTKLAKLALLKANRP